jgi:hypothetical protein
MRLPHFLIVGAMKAGTTTLYRDLCLSPEIFMPEQKEPDTLLRFSASDEIRSDWNGLFPKSSNNKIRGEASTAYTKRPLHEGIAERAYRATDGNLQIVYIKRDPVARVVSHYKHALQHRLITAPFPEALRTSPELIAFSRYEWQIAPWKAAFGEERVYELTLEELAGDRRATVKKVLAHIGADPALLPEFDNSRIENAAGEKFALGDGLLHQFIMSRLYQRRLKPLLPRSIRGLGQRTMLSRHEDFSVDVTDEDRRFVLDMLAVPI